MLPGCALPTHLQRAALRCYSSATAAGPLLHQACLDEVRGVVRLSGPGLVHFLQGLVTNDVLSLEAAGAAPLYACILNAQGRHLHDLLLHRTQDAEPTVLADVDAAGKEDLLRLLKRYRLRQKVDIQDVSPQYRVWAQYGGDAAALAAAAAAPPPGWAADPRLPQLGLRAVLPAGQGPAVGGGGGEGWRAYRRWRILQGIAEGDAEMPTGEVIPLEFNLDGLSGISFTKGCYVGQELMAHTHFKGVVRKRLMPFVAAPPGSEGQPLASDEQAAADAADADTAPSDGDAAAAAAVQPGAAVYVEQPGGKRKSVGVVRVADGRLGLAVLRLSEVAAARAAGQPLLVGEGGAMQISPWRPAWWPEGWGREEGQDAGADA